MQFTVTRGKHRKENATNTASTEFECERKEGLDINLSKKSRKNKYVHTGMHTPPNSKLLRELGEHIQTQKRLSRQRNQAKTRERNSSLYSRRKNNVGWGQVVRNTLRYPNRPTEDNLDLKKCLQMRRPDRLLVLRTYFYPINKSNENKFCLKPKQDNLKRFVCSDASSNYIW